MQTSATNEMVSSRARLMGCEIARGGGDSSVILVTVVVESVLRLLSSFADVL